MRIAGEQRIGAPRQRVWEALNDPEVLQACIPGCQTLEKEAEDRFSATVEIKIGPIGARFKGSVSLTELDPPNSYVIVGQGNGGIAGTAKGSAKVRLSDDAGGTLVSYEVDAQVGGRMAQLGGPIIDATARQLSGKFFSRFGEIVGPPAKAIEPAPVQATPVQATPVQATPVQAATIQAPPPARAAQPASAQAAGAAAPAAPIHTPTPAPSRGFPVAWVLALVVAALAGFLFGRGQAEIASDWAGLTIGLLVIVVAGAAFDYGRRAATPVLMLDSALLRRLIDGVKE